MFLKWEDESESVTGFCLFIIITDGIKEWEHVDGIQWGLWILLFAMEPDVIRVLCNADLVISEFLLMKCLISQWGRQTVCLHVF